MRMPWKSNKKNRGVALFDFVPSPDFPEQVGVVKEESFRVLEDCGDGWTMIKKSNGEKGVIPTSYLVDVPLTTAQKFQHAVTIVSERVAVWVSTQVNLLFSLLVSALSWVSTYLYENVYHPLIQALLQAIRKNQAAQTLLSQIGRNYYRFATVYFLEDLSSAELDQGIEEVEEYLMLVRREEQSRIPTTRSSFLSVKRSPSQELR